jgi:Predicted membrane protein
MGAAAVHPRVLSGTDDRLHPAFDRGAFDKLAGRRAFDRQGQRLVTAGGISFLAAHICFVLLYAGQVTFSAVNWAVAIPAAVVYFAVTAAILWMLRGKTPKPMFVPMFLYLLANATMNVFALMQLLCNPCAGSAVAYCGAVLFYISDCSLYLNKFYEKPIVFKKHFTIMLTYILGEFLITQGMLMLGL